jgi:hypothetical protein
MLTYADVWLAVLSNKIFKKVPELAAALTKGWAQLDSDRATASEMRAMLLV